MASFKNRYYFLIKNFLVNKLKKDFDVQISVPNESLKSDQIQLEGKKENVEKVREFIADIVETQETRQQAANPRQYTLRETSPPPPKQDFEITGAPWQIDSLEQFPTIGSVPPVPTTPLVGQVWGQRR